MYGGSRAEKSPICLALLKAGLVKGSREYKAAYLKAWRLKNSGRWKKSQRKYRQSPKGRAVDRAIQKRFRQKMGTAWNSKRVADWRKANPSKWRAIAKRASRNGLHKRWYAKHREEKLRKSYERSKLKNPLYGLTKKRQRAAKGQYDIGIYLSELGDALARIVKESNKG